MGILANENAISSGGYQIQKSLRTRASASAYLNRTPGSASNRKTWTYSAWIKRGALSTNSFLLNAGPDGNNRFQIYFQSDNTLRISNDIAAATTILRVTTQVFRDPSSWYHVVIAWDTTQATAANRLKLYINGSEVTAFSTNNNVSQNYDGYVDNTVLHNINSSGSGTANFDGYLAEVNFVDGQALTPSSFGSTNALTGVWQPAKYTGTYGTNGFYLPFTNTSTTSTLVADSSGNGNNWTPNNISLTAGVTYDSMLDSPTLGSTGTQPIGNYCVLNPLARMQGTVGASNISTISNANLTAVPSANNNGCQATFGLTSGKWYWEVNVVTGTTSNNVITGISYNGSYTVLDYGVAYEAGGNKSINGASTAYGASTTTNDVIGVAVDVGANTITFYKNNASQGTISYTPTSLPVFPAYWAGGAVSASHAFNFGQRPFVYTPPTGYVALCTTNLPDSTVVKGNKYMDATLYTGNGATRTITGYNFEPDFTWIKGRSTISGNRLFDTVRGATKALYSNLTLAEATESDSLTAFTTTGYSLGADTVGGGVNVNGTTYVGWGWNAGSGSSSSNTSGSITSTVSVNATAGFSVVTYTGNGTNGATVGHSLGVAPKMIIYKSRNAVGNWLTYHTSTGNNQYLYMNSTAAAATASGIFGTSSTTFTLQNYGDYNASGTTYVAYCFAEIAGFSKFGSYTGNGSADGPFTYTGFRPKYIMIKRTDTVEGWELFDTSRSSYNTAVELLEANASTAESTSSGNAVDILSNGFKQRNTRAATNANGGTYIYACFAENPFKNALAR